MTKHAKPPLPLRSGRFGFMAGMSVVLAVGLLTGCDEEQIQSYQAPKAPAYAPPTPMGPTAAGPGTAAPSATWELPDDWQPVPSASGMELASFEAPGESGTARVTVTPLSGQAGGIMPNINRWRGQVGLESIQIIDEQPMTVVQVDQAPAGLIDLVSPPGTPAEIDRMLVVLVPRQQESRTWFFKMIGPKDTIAQHKQAFIGFVESVSFGGPAGE